MPRPGGRGWKNWRHSHGGGEGRSPTGRAPPEISPLESQRSWERQAESNILERAGGKSGLLGPPGRESSEVLNTVVSNLDRDQ